MGVVFIRGDEMNDNHNFGDTLRELRKKHALSQQKLAELIQVSLDSVVK